MDLAIYPSKLKGSITQPPSKSQAHRAIICASLAEGDSLILNLQLSVDIHATLSCMRALGANAAEHGGIINGCNARRGRFDTLPELDCAESGSTLRFLIPIALAVAGGGVFSGRGRLMERPQKPYQELFEERGIRFERRGGKIEVEGELKPGLFRIAGNVSSQFITGLLFALPLLDGPSTLTVTGKVESGPYIDMTLNALGQFGITVPCENQVWSIPAASAIEILQSAASCSSTVAADSSSCKMPSDSPSAIAGRVQRIWKRAIRIANSFFMGHPPSFS
jgi:3-phosphoshikimate 1-carboxyvinyltransferase